jgi:hypothetical protein
VSNRNTLRLAVMIWLLVIVAGGLLFEQYKATPGHAETTRSRLAAPPIADANADRLRMLMMIHPNCPCTNASLEELAKLLASHPDLATVELLIVKPHGAPSEWGQARLSEIARSLPQAQVRIDADGALANQLGATTSGHTVVFAPNGEMLFSGGITRARGHEGDSSGSRQVSALLDGKRGDPSHAAVYGCPLLDTSQCSATN